MTGPLPFISSPGCLSVSTLDILCQIVLCLYGRGFVPLLWDIWKHSWPLFATNSITSPPTPLPVVTTKIIFRQCQMSPGMQSHPCWKPLFCLISHQSPLTHTLATLKLIQIPRMYKTVSYPRAFTHTVFLSMEHYYLPPQFTPPQSLDLSLNMTSSKKPPLAPQVTYLDALWCVAPAPCISSLWVAFFPQFYWNIIDTLTLY